MASQSRFLTKLIIGRRLRSFFVAAAIKRTPSTAAIKRTHNKTSSLASVLFVAFFRVAISPSVISSWLASSDVFFVIVGGASLCLLSSCIVLVGSTRLTQISSSNFCSPDNFVWVALAVVSVSVWHDLVSSCPVIFFCSVWLVCSPCLSLKMILGKFDVFRVSSDFF